MLQLLVLGMHRGGTSVLTHLLHRMGCHAGPPESLQPADAANERGYWERWDAWALDEQILAAAGTDWRQVADLDLDALPEDVRARFTAHARELVADLDAHGPWVLKDPRLCLLLPVWRPALATPVFVLTHRDPLETARSLRARDGLPLAVGIALWEVYNLAALRHSRGAPRFGVSHRRLLTDPGGVAASLAADLAPFAPGTLRVPDAAGLAEVVAADLRHQTADPEEHAGFLNGNQQALWCALDDGTALTWEEVPHPSAGALDALRSWSAAEREGLRLTRRAADLERRCAESEGAAAWRREREVDFERWVASLQQALATAEEELGRLRGRDAEISAWNDTLTARLAAAEGDLQARWREVEELRGLLGEMKGLMEQTRLRADALDLLVEAVLGSRSWRLGWSLTAPARWGRQDVSAESRQAAIRSSAASLEAARRDLAARAARWLGEEAG